MLWDAFVVGEEWISEHYFTTDSTKASFQAEVLVLQDRWKAEAVDGHATPRSRFAAVRGGIASALATAAETDGTTIAEVVHVPLKEALGWGGGGQTVTRNGPVTGVASASTTTAAKVVLIEARPVDTLDDLLEKHADTLAEPYLAEEDDSHPIRSVPRLLSALFVEEDGPDYAVVFAGRWVLIAERERWPEGRYLAIDLQLVADRNAQGRGGEIDRAVACLHAGAFIEDAEGMVWWTRVLEKSREHTVSVSKDLRDGVRRSIEIIGNDVVARRAWMGLDPLPPEQAQPLAKQALRYLYRILFLLFAEASPELEVLPVGALEYREGYSLDRLRDLVLTEIEHDEDASRRTHFHDSLAVLFRMVDQGSPESLEGAESSLPEGLDFQALRADLFLQSATSLIDEVKLSDRALQQVLERLLLTKERTKTERGFISYAQLGINQLGAVYEGLMSYTGTFATEELLEVAKDGDSSKGSWVVPVDRATALDSKHLVKTEDELTGMPKPVRHQPGTFVYRLAGRERQQSASYYTPEVLTRFVVSQALEELLDQDGHVTTSDEILQLTVCEPALGSGAFAIEAVRQLADQYLSRRQKELGKRIDPEEHPKHLQRVKASIALHQVYGVDLNATAVEFAEISLWLDTMAPGLQAPWFGLHLRRGNSLIGCRRAVFSRQQIDTRSWLGDVPMDLSPGEDIGNSIHHFLLPAPGWGAAAEGTEAKSLAPEARKTLIAWAKAVKATPTKQQIDQLQNLAARVEVLWEFALRRLQIAEQESRRAIKVWGRSGEFSSLDHSPVPRAVIERTLSDPEGAYQRLRRVMDAWNALWFWPLTDTLLDGATPPTLEQWIDGLRAIVGVQSHVRPRGRAAGAEMLGLPSGWEDLGVAEQLDLGFASAQRIDEVLQDHPWLRATERIAHQEGFFHWHLDFAPVFAQGGFSLQVGNPPWVRPRSDVESLLAEADPWWQVKAKSTAEEDAWHRGFALQQPGMEALVVDATAQTASLAAYVGSAAQYPYLVGLQPDLYRCFMEQTWRAAAPAGVVGLIHLESHFTSEEAGLLRAQTYRRLRRHWQFINELKLFEIQNQRRYGVSIYGASRDPHFLQSASLYHPSTVEASLKHDGSGSEPGIKDLDGNWDLRPHGSRIVTVDIETLRSWHAVLETENVPVEQTRMVYAVNKSTADVLEKLAAAPRLAAVGLHFSAGWQEKTDRTKGFFDAEWGVPDSWDSVILQGSHLGVGRPLFKYPNQSMLHNTDWTETDVEALDVDERPVTSYKRRGPAGVYDTAYTQWETGPAGTVTPARNHYRLAWRNMAASTGERTLISAVIPPGAAHIHGVSSAGLPGDERLLVTLGAFTNSLLLDFAVRVAPQSTISASTLNRLPFTDDPGIRSMLLLRALRLNALTRAYQAIWEAVFDERFMSDAWTDGGATYRSRPPLGLVTCTWTPDVPLRRSVDRRQALLETDVLVALALGVEYEELAAIYRTQFPVLYGYDRRSSYFDREGRQVPRSVVQEWKKNGSLTDMQIEWSHPESAVQYRFEAPFVLLDREADMRIAYEQFQERIAVRR